MAARSISLTCPFDNQWRQALGTKSEAVACNQNTEAYTGGAWGGRLSGEGG